MEVEGFIKLPIKTMTQESLKKIENIYLEYQKAVEYYENIGVSPENNVKEPDVNEDDFAEMTHIYVKPEAISAFKPSEDGYTDVAISSILDYSRIYMKFEEFVELLKASK